MKLIRATFVAAAITLSVVALVPSEAEAGLRFGNDQNLFSYAKTKMTDGKGKQLDLCYLTETYHVFAPVYTTDRKVLCDVKTKRFWELPTGARLAEVQKAGYIPNPIPAYNRPWWHIALGYSLWFVLGAMGIYSGAKRVIGDKKTKNETTNDETLEGEEQLVVRS